MPESMLSRADALHRLNGSWACARSRGRCRLLPGASL